MLHCKVMKRKQDKLRISDGNTGGFKTYKYFHLVIRTVNCNTLKCNSEDKKLPENTENAVRSCLLFFVFIFVFGSISTSKHVAVLCLRDLAFLI